MKMSEEILCVIGNDMFSSSHKESDLGNFVCDAFRWCTDSDVCFV